MKQLRSCGAFGIGVEESEIDLLYLFRSRSSGNLAVDEYIESKIHIKHHEGSCVKISLDSN